MFVGLRNAVTFPTNDTWADVSHFWGAFSTFGTRICVTHAVSRDWMVILSLSVVQTYNSLNLMDHTPKTSVKCRIVYCNRTSRLYTKLLRAPLAPMSGRLGFQFRVN